MTRFGILLALFLALLVGLAHPAQAQQAASAGASPLVRQPTAEEEQQIARALRAILRYSQNGVPDLVIEESAKVEPLIAQTYGTQHTLGFNVRLLHANALTFSGKFDEAEALLASIQAGLEAMKGADGALVQLVRSTRASNLAFQGRLADAERLWLANDESSRGEGKQPAARVQADADLAYLRRLQGRFAEAERLAREVVAAREASLPPGDAATASARASLSRALSGLGRLDEAAAVASGGLEGYLREDTGKARLLHALGEVQSLQGRAKDAQASFRQAALILVKLEGFDSPNTIDSASRSRLEELRYTGILPQLDTTLPANPMLACPSAFASQIDVNMAMLTVAITPWSERQAACLRKARDFLAGTMGSDAPMTLAVREQLADALDRAGDTDAAESEARTLLAAREKVNGTDHPATMHAAAIYGSVLSKQGRAEDARILLARAKGPALVEARLFEARRLDAIADYAAAATAWQAALDAAGAQPQPSVPMLLEIVAGYMINQGMLGQCPADLRAGIDRLAGMGATVIPKGGAALREAQAIMLTCDGKWQEARDAYHVLQVQTNDGVLFQNTARAQLLARQAILFSRNPEYFEVAQSAASEAMLIARERRFTPDRDAAGKPLGLRRALTVAGTDPLALAYASQIGLSWARQQARKQETDPKAALLYASSAFAAAQDFALGQAAASLLQSAARRAVPDPALGTLIDRQTALAQRLDAAEHAVLASGKPADPETAASMEANRAELRTITGELRQRYPAYAEAAYPFGLSIFDLRKRLEPGEAVLLIQPVGNEVFSFAVSGESQAWNKASLSRKDIDRLVKLVRCRIDRESCTMALPDNRLFDPAVAHRLYRAVVEPVVAGLGDARTVYTVAGGSLSGIPLGLLVTDHAPAAPPADQQAELSELAALPWLAQRYALAALPSVSSLRAFANSKPQHSVAFAGIGDPVLGPPADEKRGGSPLKVSGAPKQGQLADIATIKSLHSLPGTRRELISIAQALGAPATQLKLGPDAREAAIKAWPALQEARIVVFATHAMLPSELAGSSEPGLILTPPTSATAADDGYLTASEAAQLRLAADWVVLSACNTAGPDGGPGGESLSGLARAFLFAGAHSLLVSHWPVNDKVGAAITSETFRIMAAHPELSRAESYRHALLGIRTGKSYLGGDIAGWSPDWSDPWAWAPFTLVDSGG